MIRQRHRIAFVCLGIFALLGQLLLPNAHAQSWAQRGGNPLLYAFCGQMSPALAAQFREVAPPELLQSLASDHVQTGLSCDLCPAVHGVAFAGTGPLSILDGLALAAGLLQAAPSPGKAHWRISESRLARGPPLYTLV